MADVADAVLAGDLRFDAQSEYRAQHLGDVTNGVGLAAADVEGVTCSGIDFEGKPARLRHVADTDEVAALQPVFEDQRPIAVQQAGGEDRQHPGVGIRQRLACAEDVEEPERHRRNVVGGPHHQTQLLLVKLGECVDRGQFRPLVFGRRHRRERPAIRASEFPPALRELLARTRGAGHDRSPGGSIGALAVQAHARRNHQPFDRPFHQRLEQHGGADVVDRGVSRHLVHALADTDGGGEVVHRIDAIEGAPDRIGVAHIATYELDVVVQIVGPSGVVAVDLRRKHVERAHLVTVAQQLVTDVRSDEPCASCDQYSHQPLRSRPVASTRPDGQNATRDWHGKGTYPDQLMTAISNVCLSFVRRNTSM